MAKEVTTTESKWKSLADVTTTYLVVRGHYDLGKIAMKQGQLAIANTHFQKAYDYIHPGKPTHQSVMAVLYHQGMLRLAEGKAGQLDEHQADEQALTYFGRCLTICQINESKRGDQGESARVKWRMSQVLDRQGKTNEAAAFRDAAENTKVALEHSGLFPHVDDPESSWDCFLGQLYR